jgi:hypothetical protein
MKRRGFFAAIAGLLGLRAGTASLASSRPVLAAGAPALATQYNLFLLCGGPTAQAGISTAEIRFSAGLKARSAAVEQAILRDGRQGRIYEDERIYVERRGARVILGCQGKPVHESDITDIETEIRSTKATLERRKTTLLR